MPTASIRTCTSPGPGSSIGMSASRNVRGAMSSAARIECSSSETIPHRRGETKKERTAAPAAPPDPLPVQVHVGPKELALFAALRASVHGDLELGHVLISPRAPRANA